MASRKERIRSELLVLRCRRGDTEALGELVALWERPLLYYIRRMVDSEEDAWDVLQEVWCRVVRKIGTLRDSAAFPAWLYRIARNIAINHIRDAVRLRELRESNDCRGQANSDTGSANVSFDAEGLHRGLGRLSLGHREALILHYLEGFSLAEIAEVAGVPVGTVKSRIHFARKALRAALTEEARGGASSTQRVGRNAVSGGHDE